jgi:hypothetical protein
LSSAADLRLALYLGAGAEIITAQDYLALPDSRRPPEVSPSWCTLSLVVDGREKWGPLLSLGALGPIVAQMVPAAERIDAGQRALIRAAVFDVPLAVFLLFEPVSPPAEAIYMARVAATHALSDPVWMPNGPGAGNVYGYVAEHHDEMTGSGAADIEPCPVPRSALSSSLRREAAFGAEIVTFLGPGSS